MDEQVQEYLAKAPEFSKKGELYQSIPDGSVKATRDTKERWDAYGIKPEHLVGKTVLDVGCNAGGFAFYCEGHCQSYLGIDVDSDSIALAQHLYPFSNCSFRVQDIRGFKGEFDVVFAFAVRYYTRLSVAEWAVKMASLIRPGGLLFYESHGRTETWEAQREAFIKLFSVQRIGYVPLVSTSSKGGTRFFAEMRRR